MFAKVLAVLSVGSALLLLPREPAQPLPQDAGFTLTRAVLQNCEVDIRPKNQRPMTVQADYEETFDETMMTYTVSFEIAVPSEKVYAAGNAADDVDAVYLLPGVTNLVTLTWDYGASTPTLSLVITNGTDVKTIAQSYEGSFDKLQKLKISTYEVRRLNANPRLHRIRVAVEGCGLKTAFTLSDR